VKRLLLFAAVAFASFTAACGGGGSTPPPPPPVGNFSDASLKGQYAFAMSGEDLNQAFIARVGSFIADGAGNITMGLEDVNSVAGVNQVSFTGGTYAIQPNGRGTLTLSNAVSSLQLSITLISNTKGLMIQTDFNATSSGNFILQSPGAFSNPGISGKYIFDVSGVDASVPAFPISIVGQIQTDGSGNVQGGTMDVNDGAATGPSGALAVPKSTYAVDNNTNGTTFGRGTIIINGINFVFYVVDTTRFKLMEIDTGATLGDAALQTGTIPMLSSGFTGSFAFLVGGSSVLGTMGPLTRAGRFTADGSGNLNRIFLDTNNFGSRHSTTPTSISSASYTIDATTTVVGSGRGTLTIQDSGLTDAFKYVFYLISPTQAVIQDTSNGVIADGSMLAQSAGPLTFPTTGNFAFNWSGIILNSSNTIQFEEDFVGQYSPGSPGANGFNGAMDFEELGSSGKNLFTNVPITVSTSINSNVPDGTGPNGYQVVTGNSPSTTFTYRAYIVDQNTLFLMGFDGNQVIAGIVSAQP
jgi:hypothetical protein